jgi:hypothetical protein
VALSRSSHVRSASDRTYTKVSPAWQSASRPWTSLALTFLATMSCVIGHDQHALGVVADRRHAKQHDVRTAAAGAFSRECAHSRGFVTHDGAITHIPRRLRRTTFFLCAHELGSALHPPAQPSTVNCYEQLLPKPSGTNRLCQCVDSATSRSIHITDAGRRLSVHDDAILAVQRGEAVHRQHAPVDGVPAAATRTIHEEAVVPLHSHRRGEANGEQASPIAG